jgi:lactococcin 972 family bacteriocin
MKQHMVAKISSLAVAFMLLVGTSAFTTPAVQAASSLAAVGPKSPTPHTIVNVGGGTWNYGTENCGLNCKHAWSYYVHNSLYHSATAICGTSTQKIFANATQWAYANATCGWTDSTAAYWATY